MKIFPYRYPTKKQVLALGAESAGNFSVFSDGKIYFSDDFGDLLIDANFRKFKKGLDQFLKKEKIAPDVILTDVHPLMNTTLFGRELAKKYKAEQIQIQHHHAHIFSAMGEHWLRTKNPCLPAGRQELRTAYGIAMDGTGYGEDGKIWGGECFAISNFQFPISNQFSNLNDKISKQKIHIERIGHLENQTMIGGELAIREPARMLIAILAKVRSPKSETSPAGRQVRNKFQAQNSKIQKDFVYSYVKKYYSRNQFELLYNQLRQNFNCIETSSAGRILDAISLLLGFCGNIRAYKHQPLDELEKNSTIPYKNLKPKIFQDDGGKYILDTTHLFNYVINYLHKDKGRLAATAQLYIAEGLHGIVEKKIQTASCKPRTIFAAGGVTNSKIVSRYFASKNIFFNHDIPRGDAGLSLGQIMFFLSGSQDDSR